MLISCVTVQYATKYLNKKTQSTVFRSK